MREQDSAAQAQEPRAKTRRKVLDILSQGGKYSVADIVQALGLCDPRAHIRDLRKAGIPIADTWVHPKGGSRYKLYYLSNN